MTDYKDKPDPDQLRYVSARFPMWLFERMKDTAIREDRTISSLIRLAVEGYVAAKQ